MWKLKIAEGGSPWLRSVNNYIGRQVWEFDPKLGTPEELAEIERARETFSRTRFEKKHSADLLLRLQVMHALYRYVCLSTNFIFAWRRLLRFQLKLLFSMNQ